jgi:hypothetical protein
MNASTPSCHVCRRLNDNSECTHPKGYNDCLGLFGPPQYKHFEHYDPALRTPTKDERLGNALERLND